MILCACGEFVPSLPLEENFAHHVRHTYLVLHTTVSEIVMLQQAYCDVIQGYEPRVWCTQEALYLTSNAVHSAADSEVNFWTTVTTKATEVV